MFSVINNYQSFIITYFSFIYTHTVETITMLLHLQYLNIMIPCSQALFYINLDIISLFLVDAI